MSTPPNGAPPIQLPPVAGITCEGCNQPIQVRLPKPRIANAPDASIIMFVHERLDKCPHCGAVYLFQIHGIDQNGTIGFAWGQVQNQTSAIVPGNQRTLSEALATDETAKKIKLN